MFKRIRRPDLVTGTAIRAEIDVLETLAGKWLAIAASTEPVDAPRATTAVRALYSVCGLKEPRVVIVSGPIVMALAGGLAAAILHSQKRGVQSLYEAGSLPLREFWAYVPRTMDQIVESPRKRNADSFLSDDIRRVIDDKGHHLPMLNRRQHWWMPRNIDLGENHFETTSHVPEPDSGWKIHAAARRALRKLFLSTRGFVQARSHEPSRLGSFDALLTTLSKDCGYVFDISSRMLRELSLHWHEMLDGGNLRAGEAYRREAIREVFGLEQPNTSVQEAWEECCRSGGLSLYHEEFCIISERPEQIHFDEHGRLHCDYGPAAIWRDGSRFYHWHGVNLPARMRQAIEHPEGISLEAIESEENSELRRVLIERYGMKRYIENSGATVQHELPEDHPITGLRTARLLCKNGALNEPMVFVDLLNSTPEPDGSRKRYLLRVDHRAYDGMAAKNVHAAAASTWRNADGRLTFSNWRDYRPQLES